MNRRQFFSYLPGLVLLALSPNDDKPDLASTPTSGIDYERLANEILDAPLSDISLVAPGAETRTLEPPPGQPQPIRFNNWRKQQGYDPLDDWAANIIKADAERLDRLIMGDDPAAQVNSFVVSIDSMTLDLS